MTSTRPYLLRAIHEWIKDNHLTPHLLIDASADGVDIPSRYVVDGQLILNISPTAVRDLDLGNDAVSCNVRFAGVATRIDIPLAAIKAIYAKENGKGIVFTDDEPGKTPPDADSPGSSSRGRPQLKLVE
ncbi:MAG: ClpXP protease specificity-enhancing factor [Gammaproteobacteria bacterium]|nr:ClpXP protease specificity-enhancing factor [Gammaproteobacteria bacterium]